MSKAVLVFSSRGWAAFARTRLGLLRASLAGAGAKSFRPRDIVSFARRVFRAVVLSHCADTDTNCAPKGVPRDGCKTHYFSAAGRSIGSAKQAFRASASAHNWPSLCRLMRATCAQRPPNRIRFAFCDVGPTFQIIKEQSQKGIVDLSTSQKRFQQRFLAALLERGDGGNDESFGCENLVDYRVERRLTSASCAIKTSVTEVANVVLKQFEVE